MWFLVASSRSFSRVDDAEIRAPRFTPVFDVYSGRRRYVASFRRISRGGFTVSVISIRDDTRFRHFRSEGTSDACLLAARHPVDVRHAPTFYCYAWCLARTHEGRQSRCGSSLISCPATFHDKWNLNISDNKCNNIATFKITTVILTVLLFVCGVCQNANSLLLPLLPC